MFHSILQYKTELIASAIISGVVGFIGLLANGDTSPKVFAVMVYLSDWNAIWTWEWWALRLTYLAIGVGFWWFQKRKYDKRFAAQQTEWASKVSSLQNELNHVEVMLSTAQVRISVLERK